MTTQTTKCGRQVCKPLRFADFIKRLSVPKAKQEKPGLWEISDVNEKRPGCDGDEVSVQSADWEGPCQRVGLRDNPELRSYLHRHDANPDACTLIWNRLASGTPHALAGLDDELLLIRSKVFDQLGGARFTPEGNTGFQTRVSVSVPFGTNAWKRYFGPLLGHQRTEATDTHVTVTELTGVLGEGWDRRSFRTSTETYVSKQDGVRVKWGFQRRTTYNHDPCLRCSWQGPESSRPESCQGYTQEWLPAPPEVTLIFTRKRRNRVLARMLGRIQPMGEGGDGAERASELASCDDDVTVDTQSTRK